MKITADESTFIIEGLVQDQLVAEFEENRAVFQKKNDCFRLPLSQLLTLCQQPNRPVVLRNALGEAVLAENVIYGNDVFIKEESHTYFLYVDQDQQLTLIYNKKPSIFHFYRRDAEVTDINANDKAVRVTFQFTTMHCVPKDVYLYLEVRKQEGRDRFKASFQYEETAQGRYVITAQVTMKAERLKALYGEQIPYHRFNSDIYDASFWFRLNELPISAHHPKLFCRGVADEHWTGLDENYQNLVKPYATVQGHFALRMIPVPLKTYALEQSGTIEPLVESGRPVIICTEYPEKAQDNGVVFFRYLMKNYSKRFTIYYVVSEESADLENLHGYEAQTVFYKSPEHLRILHQADVICHTHTANYAAPYITNRMEELIRSKKRVFLRHGIVASKDISSLYARKENDDVANLVVASSIREQELVVSKHGFAEEEVMVTGLARFDDVIRERRKWLKRFKNRKSILIMPTWRPGMHTLTEEKFMETAYYQTFQKLINDERIKELVDQGAEVSFYLHRNFQRYSGLFQSDTVKVITQHDRTVKELLSSHQTLVTDYSSVGLDVALMHKKVVYFRPEVLKAKDHVEEPPELLPGPVVQSIDELFQELSVLKMEANFKENLHQLYHYNDTNACKRIAETMVRAFNL